MSATGSLNCRQTLPLRVWLWLLSFVWGWLQSHRPPNHSDPSKLMSNGVHKRNSLRRDSREAAHSLTGNFSQYAVHWLAACWTGEFPFSLPRQTMAMWPSTRSYPAHRCLRECWCWIRHLRIRLLLSFAWYNSFQRLTSALRRTLVSVGGIPGLEKTLDAVDLNE